jgi:hypothetical protein
MDEPIRGIPVTTGLVQHQFARFGNHGGRPMARGVSR